MPASRALVASLLLATALGAAEPVAPLAELAAPPTDEAVTATATAFWSAFCRVDLDALARVADDEVVSDVRKHLWIGASIDRAYGRAAPAPADAKAAAEPPPLRVTAIDDAKVMQTQVLVREIPARCVHFTSGAFSGTIRVSLETGKVIAVDG